MNKLFPIQRDRDAKPHPMRIPWSVAELAYSVYSARYGTSQSLETLAERGGFGAGEMDKFLPDWRDRCDEIIRLRAENTRFRKLLERFVQGHLYADEELSHLPNRDDMSLNPYDTDRSPTFGDCRKVADELSRCEHGHSNDTKKG
jgi:hypothetical protein